MKFTFLLLFMCGSFLTAQNIPLYVGTYTNGESKGIYYYDFDSSAGKLTNKKLAIEAINPSFITFSNDKKFIYAVSESDKGSLVFSYSVSKNGSLDFLNKVSSNGKGPCHVQLNAKNDKVVVSNYGGGTVSIYDVQKSGEIQDAFQVIDHNAPGIPAHAHSAKFLKNELFVADLGRDFLAQYTFKDGSYNTTEKYMMAKKAGPRHFEITKNGNFIYVINELNSTVTALKRGTDSFAEIQTIRTTRDDYKGMNSCADIHLSKDENFLYGSNRGENTIVVYKRDKENGNLEKIQSVSVKGDWPRNFRLSPDGKFMLVANERSNSISVFKVDKSSGELTYLYSETTPAPVCLLF